MSDVINNTISGKSDRIIRYARYPVDPPLPAGRPGGFLHEFINLKDCERPFLEIFAPKLYLIIYAKYLTEINTSVHQRKPTQT